MLKPVPVRVAELMVTGAVPVDVKVTDLVDAVFTVTLPKPTLVALTLRVGTNAFNCNAKDLVTLPALALSVTACAVLTDETVAANPALVALAGTDTLAGTAAAALLLDRFTLCPPLPAAALKVTVQLSDPEPVMEPLVHESPLNTGAVATPVPLRPISAVGLADELLAIVTWPVAAPALAGSNCKLKVAACFDFKVSGNVAPDMLKPVPVRVAELIVTGAVPVDVKVTDLVDLVFTVTLPKPTLVALTLRVGTNAFSCRAKLAEAPFADALRVADCAELTDETVAVKLAVVALAGTVTEAGTITAALLLVMATLCPPLPAAALIVTEQASVPAPVIDPLEHESALGTIGALPPEFFLPLPCNFTKAVGLAVELLAIVTCPVDVPSVLGLKCTLKLIVLPAARVTGRLPSPSIEKEFPDKVNSDTSTGLVPWFTTSIFVFTD